MATSLIHCCPGNLFGGVERMLMTIARTNRTDADPDPDLGQRFAVCFDDRLAGDLRSAGAGVEVGVLGPVRFSKPWTILQARRALRRFASSESASASASESIFVFHGGWIYAALAPGVRGSGRRWLALHDIASRSHWVERLASRTRPDRIIANSRATAEAASALFPGVASAIIAPPVPMPIPKPPLIAMDERERIRGSLGALPQETVIIMTARWEPIKGHEVLIGALSRPRLRDRDRDRANWSAWIVGGPQRDEELALMAAIQGQAAAGGIGDRIRWLGARDDVMDLMAAADLYCQPNLGPEGFGITFVEAMRAGLPVVTTPIGGALDLIDETRGVSVSRGNSEELSTILADLLDDPQRRARLGAAGRAWASERFRPEDIVRQWRAQALG